MKASVSDQTGSTLLEALIAMCILTVGLLSLAQVFTFGLRQSASAGATMIAREKAREAIESVHTARDTKVITWAQIRNTAQGGIFTGGATPLRMAGADNMVNTADDCTSVSMPNCPSILESIVLPGPDGKVGTSDDVRQPLNNYTRQILIEDVAGMPALRRITVTITYTVGQLRPPPYVLVTYISSYS